MFPSWERLRYALCYEATAPTADGSLTGSKPQCKGAFSCGHPKLMSLNVASEKDESCHQNIDFLNIPSAGRDLTLVSVITHQALGYYPFLFHECLGFFTACCCGEGGGVRSQFPCVCVWESGGTNSCFFLPFSLFVRLFR